ncbi:ATP-binding protein [Arthrobacter sp. Alg241-R88]|uniref:sensor histidine kinase n=1 Tax=Arthrobacter sp. Alg241-R88 TaxID=2305984 RepID=UPI0013D8866A|nr:ATP-binding protein [Arthrobacter sp. Alg241-R88]
MDPESTGPRSLAERFRPGRTRWGVRKRATASAVVVVAGALLVAGSILLILLQTYLSASTETAALRKADDVIAQMADHDVEEAAEYIMTTAHAGQYVQILTPAGTVFASSDSAGAEQPVTSLRPSAGEVLTQKVPGLPELGDSDDFLVVAKGVPVRGKTYTVAVASTVQVQADTVSTVAWLMLGLTPVLLAAVGLLVWELVGRSLQQVQRIRRQVSRINVHRLSGRVDVPPTADEITALALTMNSMLDRLQASEQEQRRFVSDASHELRSPLATLSAAVEVASADSTGATWNELKDVLADETARMRYLVENLLTLAKSDDGGLRIDVTDVDLDHVVQDEIRRLRATSAHRIEADLRPVRIQGDPMRLGQVLRNVLDNADKHARSRIRITLDTRPGEAVLAVDNDGDLVPEGDRLRIFGRFVRLDESRTRGSGGSGLGLAIAESIMAAHHGTISATESPAGECRFELVFPRADPVGLPDHHRGDRLPSPLPKLSPP